MIESLFIFWGIFGNILFFGFIGVGVVLVGSSVGEGMGGGGIRTEFVVVVLEVVVVIGVVVVAVVVAVVFFIGIYFDFFMRWVLSLDIGNCSRRVVDFCSFLVGVLIGRGFVF